MINLFLFINRNSSEYILENGIDITKFGNISFKYDNKEYTGITSYLNPRDNTKICSESFIILVAKVPKEDCFVINKDMININKKHNKVEAIIPLNEYILGDIIEPRVAICSSIAKENIRKYIMQKDVPILYTSSKSLYFNKKIEELKLLCENSNVDYSEAIYNVLIDELIKNDVLNCYECGDTNIYYDEKNEDLYF